MFSETFVKMAKASKWNYVFIAVIVLVAIAALALFYRRRYKKCTICKKISKWNDPAIGRQGNDFASESMLPIGARWMAQRARCVSCENDMVKRHGLSAGQFSNPTKCLTCQDKSFKYLSESIEAVHSTNDPKTIAA